MSRRRPERCKDAGVEADELVERPPVVFHAASASAWGSIQEHGLLSTARLLDLFEVDQGERDRLLTQKRDESVLLEAPGRQPALIRDQKPMKFIEERIEPDSTLARYLLAINSRVFFWPTAERLQRLQGAKEYRHEAQVVLHVDMKALVERYESQIRLCRFSSGAVSQKNHPARGHNSWLPIGDYAYAEYRRRYGARGALAEVTVLDGVSDVLDLVLKVEHTDGRK